MAFYRQRMAVYWRLLKRKQSSQNISHHSTTLEQATQIGILFKGNDPSHYVQIRNMIAPLQEEGKRVDVFAFIDGVETEEMVSHAHFNRKNVNFFYIPKGNEVSYFIQKKFDILLYAHQSFSPELVYIATLSNAKMRVGPYFDEIPDGIDTFDLLIKLEKEPSMNELLETYFKYLKMIKANGYE